MKLLNDIEFKEFLKPLEDMISHANNMNELWSEHVNKSISLAFEDFDITESQSNEYTVLCYKLHRAIYSLIENIGNDSKRLDKISKDLK